MDVAPGKTAASMLAEFLGKPLNTSELVAFGDFVRQDTWL
jgi:hypothetical protein